MLNNKMEIDAYTISKIYHDWSTTTSEFTGKTAIDTNEVALSANGVVDVFDKLMLAADNANVPAAGRILYVTNEVKSMLKNNGKITRSFDVQNGSTNMNRVIDYLDGVEVVAVPASLMKTQYNFTTGFAPASGAKQIYMALIHPLSVITPGKYEFVNLTPPSAVTEGKYYYYEEDYRDAFILNHKADGIQFYVEA